jgi:CBS domain-containing protein
MTASKKVLKAGDIMIKEPVTVQPSTTIHELARIFEENGISGAPVVDAVGRVVGVVSKSDMLRRTMDGSIVMPQSLLLDTAAGMPAELEGVGSEVVTDQIATVEDFMTEDPTTATKETPVTSVARMMTEGRIHRVIVVDGGGFPIGIITSLDLLSAFAGG